MDKPLNATPDPRLENQVTGNGAESAATSPLFAGVGEVTGEHASDGLRLPRLQIAYGVGELAKTFSPGDLVFGGDNLLVHKAEMLELVIFSATEYWKEYLTDELYKSGARPRTYVTEAEVNAAGGITTWPPKGTEGPKPDFSMAIDLRCLIKIPKDVVCGLFGLELDGAEYGAAVWTADKTAYKRVAPYLKMCRQFSLRKAGLIGGVFTLHTTIESRNGRTTPVPNLKFLRHNTPAFIEVVCALLGVPVPEGVATKELSAATTTETKALSA